MRDQSSGPALQSPLRTGFATISSPSWRLESVVDDLTQELYAEKQLEAALLGLHEARDNRLTDLRLSFQAIYQQAVP